MDLDSPFLPRGMGWQPDVPDPRDFSLGHPDVAGVMERIDTVAKETLPARVDLRDEGLLPPVEDQGDLNACCAFATLDLLEFLERKFTGRSLEGSKLFLHQMSLRLAGWPGETSTRHASGTTMRTTLKALTRLGTPPARLWPYDATQFDRAPIDPLLFAFTREYVSLRYFRLDRSFSSARGRARRSPSAKGNGRLSPEEVLNNVKRMLAAGIPCLAGVSIPRALTRAARIPRPNGRDELRGGQAVVVIGYDDGTDRGKGKKKPLKSRQDPSVQTSADLNLGGLLFRTSWGPQWGDNGHGWLPIGFLTAGFATEFWGVWKPEWSIT